MLKRFGAKSNPNDSNTKPFESLGWRKFLHARSPEDRCSRSQVDLGSITDTYGINGNFLAPTLVLNQGQQVSMLVSNTLSDSTTIHWHGMHVSSVNDGGPHTPIPPGLMWNPQFTVMDRASTLWYHPHLHHKTNNHVQKGIAGMIIVRDAQEALLNLPRQYGVDDIPVIIQSKGFDLNNQIVVETALDTTLMINGTIRPYKNLPAQIVRLRLLNGSSERVYNLGLSNGQTFNLIGTDGGLLIAPVQLSRLKLAPGERAEILIDLSALAGQTLFLKSFGAELPSAIYGAAQPGMGAGQVIPNYALNPLNGTNFNVLELRVIAQTANPVLSIPNQLVADSPWSATQANFSRTLTFSPIVMGPNAINGPFLFDMMIFDMMMINQYIPLDNIEIWTLQNNTPIAHPFHLHNVPFYILDINGVAPPAELSGRKDVVLVPAGQGTVRFITKFADFANDSIPYMYHCHMLTHEDGGMMGQFIVQSPTNEIEEINASSLSIVPNPVKEEFTLNAEENVDDVTIYAIDGSIVLQVRHPSSNVYTIQDVHPGFYVVQITLSNGTTQQKSIIKL